MEAKPNYSEFGYSDSMGKNLRQFVEKQLLSDLEFYGIQSDFLKFDWSESCIEGRCAQYLDGSFENFSGISVFDDRNKLVASGWMNFINVGTSYLIYWDNIETCTNYNKNIFGIPRHIWEKIPNDVKPNYKNKKMP